MRYIFLSIFYFILSITAFSEDFVEIHYKSDWANTFIQFNINNTGWAKLPTPEEKISLMVKTEKAEAFSLEKELSKYYFNNLGVEGNLMKESPYFKGYKYIKIPASNMRFKFSNEKSENDNNNGSTYYVESPGRYILKDKKIQKISSDNIKIYYKSDSEKNSISYKYNGSWSDEKKELEKDKLYEGYYSITAPLASEIKITSGKGEEKYSIAASGVYKINDNKIKLLSNTVMDKENTITVIQNTDKDAYISYNVDNMGWSNKAKMYSIKDNEKFITIENASNMSFTLENEAGEKTKEYSVTKGIYRVKEDKLLEKISDKSAFSTFGTDKNDLSVFSQEREIKNHIGAKKILKDTYELNIVDENHYYSLKTFDLSYDTVEIIKDGISIKTTKLLKNYRDNSMETSNIKLPIGNVVLKFYKEKGEKPLDAVMGTEEEKYQNKDVVLLSYGGWKETVDVTDLYQKEAKNYKEIQYNMWIDFIVPNEYLGNKLKLVFINNTGSTIKEYPAYKNGKQEGNLRYSIDILDAIREKGYGNEKSDSVFFKIYVGKELLGTYKYNLKEVVEKNTLITTGEFIPYNLEYLGKYCKNNQYLFEAKGKVFNVDMVNKVFYDGYYNKNKDYTNELIEIDESNFAINLKIDNQKEKKVLLKWSSSENQNYELYRSESMIGGYSKIFSGKTLEYADILPEANKRYYYKVESKTKEGKLIYSNTVFAISETKTDVQLNLEKSNETYDSIELTWNILDTVDRYEVYRSVNGNKYVNIKDLKFYNYKFIDEDLNPQNKYTYMIKGIKEKVLEISSNEVEKKVSKLQKIYNFSLDFDIDIGLKIAWEKIKGSENYIIEKSDKNSKKEVNVRGTIYYDDNMEIGKEYTYKVFAIEN